MGAAVGDRSSHKQDHPDHHENEDFFGPKDRRIEDVAPDDVDDINSDRDQKYDSAQRMRHRHEYKFFDWATFEL